MRHASGPLPGGAGVTAGPPIGRPVCNTRVFVLDRWLAPVPAGVAGELYVAGARVGPGVSGPPGADRGAVRGVPVRVAGSGCTGPVTWPGGRRTGSWSSLGRADDQVKIRGFRVELG